MHDPDGRELLERSIFEALKTYSNVHRGSGHKSMVSTALYEQARQIVLDYLGFNARKYQVIFTTPHQAEILGKIAGPGKYQILSSASFGLSIGLRAIVIRKGALPGGAPPISGGGTTKLISKEWVIWAKPPAKFEAGTPPVVNVIAFARALQLTRKYGDNIFSDLIEQKITIKEIFNEGLQDRYEGKELLYRFRETRIGLDLQVPTAAGPRKFINLDSSASTPAFGPVWNAFRKTLILHNTNGSEIIEEVRKICSDFLGAPAKNYEIIFTGNATEGINLVAGSLASAGTGDDHPVILGTLMEHSSNDLPWRNVPNHSLIRVSVDMEGFIDVRQLKSLLEDFNRKDRYGNLRIRLVTVSAASNVLGTCNNLKEISDIVHDHGAELLVDGAQLVAHRRVDIDKDGIDYFVFSAHKIYAPFGCGVLAVRKGLFNYTPQDTRQIIASGEENLAGITALGKALHTLGRIGMELIEREEQELTAKALMGMHQIPGMKILGIGDHQDKRLAQRVGVISFNLGNKVSFSVGKKLAVHSGIGVRVGCHCAHILVKHVLGVSRGLEKFQRIMQTLIPSMSFPGVVRVSLGIENTKEDIEVFLAGLKQISAKDSERTPGFSRNEEKKIFSDYSAECSESVFGNL